MEFRTSFGTIEIDEQEAAISVRISNLPSGWTVALTVRNGRLLDWGCTLEHVFLLVARGSDLRPIGFDLNQRKPFELLQSTDDPRVWSRGEAADVEVAISEAPRRILLPPSADNNAQPKARNRRKPEEALLGVTLFNVFLIRNDQTASTATIQRIFDARSRKLECRNDVHEIKGRVIKVASGNDFLFLLTEAGVVLSLGTGSRGELGLSPIEPRSEVPRPIVDFVEAEIRVMDVACGGWHSLALTDEEDVYAWGWNDDGQCGLPAEDMRIVEIPHPIDLQGAARSIRAGMKSSTVVLADGTVETFGKK